MTVFIRRASVEGNTASQRIHTVAATYGRKILQPYEYDANVYGYDAICKWHSWLNTSSCSIKDSWLKADSHVAVYQYEYDVLSVVFSS